MSINNFVYTHAFDFRYKWCPTASEAIGGGTAVINGWPFETRADVYNNGPGVMINSFYNNSFTGHTILTRYTPAYSSSAGALPWGCGAADFLWNCLVPTQSGFSFSSTQTGGFGFGEDPEYRNITTFTFTYNSASFFYSNGWLGIDNQGLQSYPITSSWKAVEPLMTASDMEYKIRTTVNPSNTNPYPATLLSIANKVYAQPSVASNATPAYAQVDSIDPLPNGANPEMITFGNRSTGSFDGRFYDLAGGVGISRQDISGSLAGYASQSHLSTTAAKINLSNELKKRRLFFPTIAATSSNSATSSPYTGVEWLSKLYPDGIKDSNDIFNTNGAIFNVKFNLKRNTDIDMFPDVGDNSQLLVYIFNIKPNVGNLVNRTAGTAGFYPPDNNIIRITNNPAMSFINPATGFLMESFNINVVQYGTNAQLVFEASGSLADNTYFGCLIDDIEFCQVGVSTDPELIEPETVGSIIANAADPFLDEDK